MIKDYAKGFLQMVYTVEAMNEVFGLEGIDDTFNLSTDEMEDHHILSIYETLGGSCLVSVRFDKDTGELSKSSEEYVVGRFDGYTSESTSEVYSQFKGEALDWDIVSTVAIFSARDFNGTEKSEEKFREMLKRASDNFIARIMS